MSTKQEATEAVREAAVPLLDPCSQPLPARSGPLVPRLT
jgi:hypothetical protein